MLLSTTVISANAAGTGPGNSTSDFSNVAYGPAAPIGAPGAPKTNLSADGTKLVFDSQATDLVPGLIDANHTSDVFVRDTATGGTTLVSATPAGLPGNGASFDPVISPDGRYVAFLSLATDLSTPTPPQTALANPTGGYVYVRDLETGTTTLLDQTPAGKASDGFGTGTLVFSPDSQSLAFIDTSDDLTGAAVDPPSSSNPGGFGMTGPSNYIYVRNLAAQATSLVSVSTAGKASSTGAVYLPEMPASLVFSPDSRSLIFASTATDLTSNPPDPSPNTTPGFAFDPTNLFLRDLSAGTTTLLTPTTDGTLSPGVSMDPVFSPDGRTVAFLSMATDLTANPAPAGVPAMSDFVPNLFIRDLTTGTTRLVSATTGGGMSTGAVTSPVFSPDGKSLAFISGGTDLVSNPVDPASPPSGFPPMNQPPLPPALDNVFLSDLATGRITAVSLTPAGQLSSGMADSLAFSPDGRDLAFTSSARDLTANPIEKMIPPVPGVPGAASGSYVGSSSAPTGGPPIDDVFVRDLKAGTTSLASVTTGGLLPVATSSGLMFSPDGRLLFFASGALDLTSNPPDTSNGGLSIFDLHRTNLFARDLATGMTTLITATAQGQLSAAMSSSALLSPDGKALYFDSDAPDLAAGVPSGSSNIYAASAPFAPPDQFQFRSWVTMVKEADGRAVVTVDRTGPSTSAASVKYAIQDGTAKAGVDYQATSGTLSFAPGQSSQTFTVPLIAGDQFDGLRTAQLVLSDPSGAGLGYPSASLELTGKVPPPSPTTTPHPGGPPIVAPPPMFPGILMNRIATPTTQLRTPTSQPAPTAPAAVASTPGPRVLDVSVERVRGVATDVVILFDRALDPATAQDMANYRVGLAPRAMHGLHGLRTAASRGRAFKVASATYDAASHQVTLVLRTKPRPVDTIQVDIKGSSGGITGADGVPLDSPGRPQPGLDDLATLSPIPSARGPQVKAARA